jgi:uncharacterized surface protein with fasciclin (FAS1) repeats
MKSKLSSFTFIATLTVLIALVAFAQEPTTREIKTPPAPTMNIVETAKASANLTTFARAIEAAGLTDTLNEAGPYTIFAPTDEAFAKLPAGTLDEWMKDKETLKKVLLHHVVSGKVSASEVGAMQSAKALEGPSLAIKSANNKVMIDNAGIVQPDIAASNGVIHAIDTVLVLPKQ